ncbi:MAG: hypothetical protein K9H61_04400 [Bacteroidia bacterium]|nr:hypothetical protein [Bacteroidia bacterium]MCF8427304.1 hypothetical protein [Bacteroidia bacterium]MCF8446217.1 hypothetical protein [Bacteroidia bacterium]
MRKFKFQMVLDYESIHGKPPPKNRLELIDGLNLRSLLIELAGINYRLKPKDKFHIDVSFEKQIELLSYYTKDVSHYFNSPHIPNRESFNKENYPIIFNRYASLLAIEEILSIPNVDLLLEEPTSKPVDYLKFIDYYLAINYEITLINQEESDESKITLETLNPKSLPLNEAMIFTDQIFTPYRGLKLFDYLLSESNYRNELLDYFKVYYKVEPTYFLFRILGFVAYDEKENIDFHFIFNIPDLDIPFFNSLSGKYSGYPVNKLMSIKKYPFIKVGKNKFILADLSLLIEKVFNQLTNDLWFDYLSQIKIDNGKSKYKYETYRGEIGYFYENYLKNLLTDSLGNYKYFKIALFDDLKLKTRDNREFTDIYIRYLKNVFIGEVKSGIISDEDKLGGDIISLYKNDRDSFFKRFGLNQLVNAISTLKSVVHEFDGKFELNQTKKIFPAIIVADKVFQTPLMAHIFNNKFQEMCKNIVDKKLQIMPLTLIHINDFERLQDSYSKNPMDFWKLIELNFKGEKVIPPFHQTINNNWAGREYPKKIIEELMDLVKEHNPEGYDK